jgi:hypothetical protein
MIGKLIWKDEPPTTGGHYWFVGLPYYSPVMVKVFVGVMSETGPDGERKFRPMASAEFPEVGSLWQSEGWPKGQWAGPMELPVEPHRKVLHPGHARSKPCPPQSPPLGPWRNA